MLDLNIALTDIMRSEVLAVLTQKNKCVKEYANLTTVSADEESEFVYKFISPRVRVEISSKEIPDALCINDTDISLFITKILERVNLEEPLKLQKKLWLKYEIGEQNPLIYLESTTKHSKKIKSAIVGDT